MQMRQNLFIREEKSKRVHEAEGDIERAVDRQMTQVIDRRRHRETGVPGLLLRIGDHLRMHVDPADLIAAPREVEQMPPCPASKIQEPLGARRAVGFEARLDEIALEPGIPLIADRIVARIPIHG